MRHEPRHIKASPNDAAPASGEIEIRREPIVLDPSMNVTEAFAEVMRGCITRVAAAAEVARHSDDPEGIHQLRVGIRRLRAAFSVFGPALPPRRPPVVAQLRSLQQKIGEVRELDVLLEETIASMPGKRKKSRGMPELIKAVRAEHIARHRRARTALGSRHCAELLSDLEPAIDRFTQRTGDAARREPIAVFAAKVLRARRRKACKLGKRVRKLDPQELHKLRIRIKKLRYAADFFSGLAHGGRNKRYLRALKELQQLLGTAHDAVVACSLIDRVKAKGGEDAEHAAVKVEEWANKSFKRTTRKLPRAWRRFDKRKQPLKSGKKQRRQAQGRRHEWAARFVAAGSAAL
ncbi:MAG: CHAD domain-containing protein [Bradyrhizobiaceae bacterium]|nr:CHAD domain-containing protein [Hyphomicrobiales bacterium]MBV9428727.1 CHAD domain-containing protein [Bradyrhizobiaceae bacterium]